MSQEKLRVEVDGGKYTVIQDHNGELRALRHGQPWRNLVGDKLVLCLAYELDEARKWKEGIIANLPKCGACAESIVCGSHMYPHDADCVYSRIGRVMEVRNAMVTDKHVNPLDYLNYQFPATVGHLPLVEFLGAIENLRLI